VHDLNEPSPILSPSLAGKLRRVGAQEPENNGSALFKFTLSVSVLKLHFKEAIYVDAFPPQRFSLFS